TGTRSGVFGTYVGPDGRTAELTPADVAITSLDTWTSPHTGSVYPSGWQVQFAAQPERQIPAMSLQLTPLLHDQELAFDRLAYWEGAVRIDGTVDGALLSGE